MSPPSKIGVLLINLGTPDDPSPKKVGAYLREFLMDPFVLDIPAFFRWFLVNVLIVPKRAEASSLLYKKVWNEDGSPLRFHSANLKASLQNELGDAFQVSLGMRYGNPSIRSALAELLEGGIDRLLVLPLYPQFSLAATKSSSLAACASWGCVLRNVLNL